MELKYTDLPYCETRSFGNGLGSCERHERLIPVNDERDKIPVVIIGSGPVELPGLSDTGILHARLRYTNKRHWNIDRNAGQLFSQLNMNVAQIPADVGFDCRSPAFTQLPQRSIAYEAEVATHEQSIATKI